MTKNFPQIRDRQLKRLPCDQKCPADLVQKVKVERANLTSVEKFAADLAGLAANPGLPTVLGQICCIVVVEMLITTMRQK